MAGSPKPLRAFEMVARCPSSSVPDSAWSGKEFRKAHAEAWKKTRLPFWISNGN